MSRYRGPRIRIVKRLGPLPGFGLKLNKKYLKFKQKNRNEVSPKNTSKRKKKSLYTVRLNEKQKLRYHYGLTEKKLKQYFRKARQRKTSTSEILLHRLEMRLDNIVFRLGLAPTLPAARQLITHGHIFLNGKKRNIPSSECKVNDFITISDKSKLTKESKNKGAFAPPGGAPWGSSGGEPPQRRAGSSGEPQTRSPQLNEARLRNAQEKTVSTSKKQFKVGWAPKPSFLTFDDENFIGKVHKMVSRDDIGLKINELLVIEYYSRNL